MQCALHNQQGVIIDQEYREWKQEWEYAINTAGGDHRRGMRKKYHQLRASLYPIEHQAAIAEEKDQLVHDKWMAGLQAQSYDTVYEQEQ